MRRLLVGVSRRFFHSVNIKMSKTCETLCLADYDCIGFDIDHTLAKYNLPVLFQDTYDAMTKYLVKAKGYDQNAFGFDQDFCTRGLVLDVEKGHFMKVAEDGRVLRASHGTRPMTTEQLKQTFGVDIHWKEFDKLIASVNNIDGRYRIFENFFDMPIGVVCAHMIDWIDKKADGAQVEKYDFWPDVFEAVDHIYHPKQFKADCGDFFPKWKEDTGLYVYKCSEATKQWLKRLRAENKKLFVLTSSLDDFAQASLKFILGDDWRSYFDFYVALARKPGFFSGNRNFVKPDESGNSVPVTELNEGVIYLQGNANVLMKNLSRLIGREAPKVLFVGDSLRSDIFPAKKFANWDTVLILEEINACTDKTDLRIDSNEPSCKKIKSVPCLGGSSLYSSRWGSLFVDGVNNGTSENKSGSNTEVNPILGSRTIWSHIVQKYADVAISNLDSITGCPMDYKFKRFNACNFNESGFYPSPPPEMKHQ